ncbi:hypothetical protein WJX73_005429 [Symbiochloris irregularis]|uniref:USP domain-containing protein n=1 Tax=Symbiochloris irregularis TaxID=706552 RepID=A0AAW1P1Y7_9CHLO
MGKNKPSSKAKANGLAQGACVYCLNPAHTLRDCPFVRTLATDIDSKTQRLRDAESVKHIVQQLYFTLLGHLRGKKDIREVQDSLQKLHLPALQEVRAGRRMQPTAAASTPCSSADSSSRHAELSPCSQEQADFEAAIEASLRPSAPPPLQDRQTADGIDTDAEDGAPATGLQNNIGEYNCFLNVIVQCLWRCQDFRVAFMDLHPSSLQAHPIVAALLELFQALADRDECHQQQLAGVVQQLAAGYGRKVVNPSVLRKALADVDGGRPFQLGEMNDAAEDIPNLATLLRLAEQQDQKKCDKDLGGCGALYSRQHLLLSRAPRVFALQLAWEGEQETVKVIEDTMACMQVDVDPSEVFVGTSGAGLRCRLCCMVGFYGAHYSAVVCNQGQWVLMDDTLVRPIGTWGDVLYTCRRGHIQPSVLFFESV